MKRNAILLAVLVVLGIVLSLYVYQGIVDGDAAGIALSSIAFLITAMFAGKLIAGFRTLRKSMRARDAIVTILLPVIHDAAHARALAENLVLRNTTLEAWPELPNEQTRKIADILAKMARRARHAKNDELPA
jgi:hypothetical protein